MLAGALLLTLAYGAVEMVVRPIIWSDSAFGFLGWEARDGLPFNYTLAVDPADISRSIPSFMSIWSPGQHLLPAALEAAGLSLGAAIVFIVTAFAVAGLVGWHALYRAWNFSPRTSALAVLLIALGRHVSAPFGIYVGGEVLLFGVAPWFLLLLWRLRGLPWFSPLPLLGGAFCMFFAKLNGVILATAAIAALVAGPGGPWLSRERVHRACVAAATIAALGLIFYWAWYSRGWTSANATRPAEWDRLATFCAFAISATWSAAFSLMDVAGYLLLHPGRAVLHDLVPVAYGFLPLALLAIAAVFWRLRDAFPDYLRFLAFAAGGYAVILVWLWVRGSAFDLEERYFRIGSLMLLAGIVETLRGAVRWRAPVAIMIIALYAVYGIGSYVMHAKTNLGYPLGSRGFRHQVASRAVLDLVARIDSDSPDRESTLIYAAWPEIGLEFRRVRVLATHADVVSPAALAKWSFHGRVPHLYVLVQKPLVDNGKAELILKAFKDYPAGGWRGETLDAATLYSPVE